MTERLAIATPTIGPWDTNGCGCDLQGCYYCDHRIWQLGQDQQEEPTNETRKHQQTEQLSLFQQEPQ